VGKAEALWASRNSCRTFCSLPPFRAQFRLLPTHPSSNRFDPLVDKLTSTFQPEQYQDTRRGRLLELVERKHKGEVVRPVPQAPAPTRLEDLMEKLRQSLEEAKEAA
jgi:hypothetical protein